MLDSGFFGAIGTNEEIGVILVRARGRIGQPVRTAGRSGAVGLAAILLSGCILQKDLPDPALDIPAAYKEAPGRQIHQPPALDWWRSFGSAELTTLMEEAQTVNLDIAAAASRILQADAQARIVGAALLPFVSASGDASRSRSSGREFSSYSASLSASYEIDFWGKNRDAALSVEELSNASRFDRDVVALTTLTAVASAYFQVLTAQDRIRIATNNIASAQRVYDAIKQRLNVGTGTDLDLAQQESVLAGQKALVPPLRQTLAQNINILATLVSRPPERVVVTGGSLRRLALPRVTPGLPSELLIQRPDIRRNEAQLASTTASVGNARAQFFPSIQLTGAGGYQSAALASLFTPQAAFFNLAAGATQPIFDGARIQSNFDLQKARQDEALQIYRRSVVSAFADVDNALVALRQTSERLRLQGEVVSASRRAFDLAEQRLRAGTADIITVLNTQLTLFQAEDSLAQVRLSRFLAVVSLYQALGGGWSRADVRTVNAL